MYGLFTRFKHAPSTKHITMKALADFFQLWEALPTEIMTALNDLAIPKTFSKGTYLLRSGQYCQQLFFVQEGLLKLSFDNGDKEFIMRFFEEGLLLTEMESLIRQQASTYDIIAIETSQVLCLPFRKFEQLCLKYHRLETFYRRFLTMAHLNMMQRVSEMLEENAGTRYKNFMARYPQLLQRISLGDLSSYLGITQVSLSRIRSNFNS